MTDCAGFERVTRTHGAWEKDDCAFITNSELTDNSGSNFDSNPDFDIYVLPLNWGKSNWLFEDSEERKEIDNLIQKLAVSKTFTYEWFDGYKKSVKLQKVSAPYVDLEKLKANPKDYKKYVKYNTQFRLSASADTMGLKEVA